MKPPTMDDNQIALILGAMRAAKASGTNPVVLVADLMGVSPRAAARAIQTARGRDDAAAVRARTVDSTILQAGRFVTIADTGAYAFVESVGSGEAVIRWETGVNIGRRQSVSRSRVGWEYAEDKVVGDAVLLAHRKQAALRDAPCACGHEAELHAQLGPCAAATGDDADVICTCEEYSPVGRRAPRAHPSVSAAALKAFDEATKGAEGLRDAVNAILGKPSKAEGRTQRKEFTKAKNRGSIPVVEPKRETKGRDEMKLVLVLENIDARGVARYSKEHSPGVVCLAPRMFAAGAVPPKSIAIEGLGLAEDSTADADARKAARAAEEKAVRDSMAAKRAALKEEKRAAFAKLAANRKAAKAKAAAERKEALMRLALVPPKAVPPTKPAAPKPPAVPQKR
jgi:hypothetical protein